MKTESVGICICCAISQVGTNEFLISIPIMHIPLYIKRIFFLASCSHHLASWLSVAIMIFFFNIMLFFFNIGYVTAQMKQI